MLLSKKVIIIWGNRNQLHYISKGYKFTKIGDKFKVNIKDITKHSSTIVEIKCDYCNKIYKLKYTTYNKNKIRGCVIDKDACKDCKQLKINETILNKYGKVSNNTDFFNYVIGVL